MKSLLFVARYCREVRCCLHLIMLCMCKLYVKFVWVDEWPPFGKELFSRFTICSVFNLSIWIHFGFENRVWFLMYQFLVFAYILL